MLAVIVAVVWIPLRRSTLGLALYAVGSSPLAAFRSGISVGRTKIVAYALTGLFSALGGLALTASGGVGAPVPGSYTLQSVAAIVLGGVSLAGGRGGVLGPIIAVFVLALVRTDLTFIGVDPNWSTADPGGDPHRRGDVRQPRRDAQGAGMTGAGHRRARPLRAARALGRRAAGAASIRDRPLIPLVDPPRRSSSSLLEVAKPGIVNANWVATTHPGRRSRSRSSPPARPWRC